MYAHIHSEQLFIAIPMGRSSIDVSPQVQSVNLLELEVVMEGLLLVMICPRSLNLTP